MPKSFSGDERAYIKRRLMEEARDCLTQYGMRRTTVDELVKRVNIPKGTFYLFYPSKELLIFDVVLTVHDDLKNKMMRRVEALGKNINADTVSQLLFDLFTQAESTFLYAFAMSGGFELLVRKLPPDVVAAHAEEDDLSVEKLLEMIPGVRTRENIKIYSSALRGIAFMIPHRREIGEEAFEGAIRVLLRGVVLQIFEEADR